MSSKQEMSLCFTKAGVLMRVLAFSAMGNADVSSAVDELLVLTEKIKGFVERASGKTGEDVANLTIELIQSQSKANEFIERHSAALSC